MKNRKLLLIVSLVLALTMSLGGTLAYLTDTDEAVNVMTLGNVKIEQTEIGADGDIFKQGQPLYPVYDNGTEKVGTIVKKVSVENTGTADAYIRTWMAFEAGDITDQESFESLIKITFAVDPAEKVNWLPGVYEIDGQKYFIANVLYSNAVKPGETVKSLDSFYMDYSAGNDDVAQFGNTYEVLVLSQGVQTNNMPGAAEAMDAAFPVTEEKPHPWVDKDIAELPTKVVKTAADLKTALEEGGMTVVLGADIDMGTEMITIPAGKNARLDLAGHDITADHSSKSGESTSLFNVKKGASLTINGDGNVHFVVPTSQKVTATINNESGNVTINGGNYTIDYGTYEQGYLIPAIVDNNTTNGAATLTINGGTFIHDRNMLRNFSNHKSEVAKIVINGGTFLADGDGESCIWNQKPSNTVPAGAGVVEINGGTFAGVKVDDEFTNTKYAPVGENVKTVVPVNTYAALVEAVNDGEDVIFTADITGTATAGGYTKAGIVMKGQTIDGNGHTLTINGANETWSCAIYTSGGTIKNLTVAGAMRGIFTAGASSDIIIDNVEFKNVIYTFNSDGGSKDYGVYISNSTVNGWTSFSDVHKEVVFTNCDFAEGSGYAFCRPYNTATFTNCVFAKGFEFDTTSAAAGVLTFEKCYYGDTLITAENAATLGDGETTFFYNGLNGAVIK